jgi:hypothetical protein
VVGPLAPLEAEIGSDKGQNSARSYPSIEVVPADSELRRRTVRQGVGYYVRIQGYLEALRHIPHRATELLRRNISVKESSQVCSRGTGGEEQKRKRGGGHGLYLIWEEMSREQTLSLQLVGQLRLDVDRLLFLTLRGG